MQNPTKEIAPSKAEIEEIKRRQEERIPPPQKKSFVGKDDVVWKPWCVNHIAMALGDALPTNRDPLKVCRVIAINRESEIYRPTECWVCIKSSRFWMAEH